MGNNKRYPFSTFTPTRLAFPASRDVAFNSRKWLGAKRSPGWRRIETFVVPVMLPTAEVSTLLPVLFVH
jgi:hypothetical protein